MLSPVEALGTVDDFQLMEEEFQEQNKSKTSLLHRLLQCYLEERRNQSEGKNLLESNLLERIVSEDGLSVLVVNLYPGNEGYTLLLKSNNGGELESLHLPYEENEFLDYLDVQELPPLLLDVLDCTQIGIYHDGCVIVELRDYRKKMKTFEKSYILLKPTNQTIVQDVKSIMSEKVRWQKEDEDYLESQLVLAMQPRLCLDPSPEVSKTANKIQFYAHKWNNRALKRSMRRISQPYLNRAVLCSNTASPPCLSLLDFIHGHYRDKRQQKMSQTTQDTDMWKQRAKTLKIPPKIDVPNFAKLHDQPKYTTDYTPEKIQEIILEGEKTNNRSYFCRVTIQRRGSTGEYIGDLYLEEDHPNNAVVPAKEEHKGGRACRFSLGNRQTAQRYLQQFQELYTEEGRKSVKISTFVTNQQQRSHQQQQQQQQQTSKSPESSLTVNLSRTLAQNNHGNLTGNHASLSKSLQSPAKVCASHANDQNTQYTTAYIQSVATVSTVASGHHPQQQLTAVPIAVQGNNVSIVQGGTQFITKAHTHQAIRPAQATGQIMLQVPGNLVPISQMTRMGAQQKNQASAMASVMVHGKQVMVQGSPAMLQGQFIPNQTALIPGLQGTQAAIIQGNSIFVQPNQQIVGSQHQGQALMIQQGQSKQHGGNSLLQSQALQGQAVFIHGQQSGQNQLLQGQAIVLQNQNQGQVQIISTTSTSNQQQLQIVPQIQKQGGSATVSRSNSTAALSALTSQVNLIPVNQGQQYQPIVHLTTQQPRPVLQRRRPSSNAQTPSVLGGAKRRPQT